MTSRYSNIFEIEGLEEDATILDLKNEISSEYGIDPRYQIIFSGTVDSSSDSSNNNNNNNNNSNSNNNIGSEKVSRKPKILQDTFKLDSLVTRELKSLDIAIVYDVNQSLQQSEQLLIKKKTHNGNKKATNNDNDDGTGILGMDVEIEMDSSNSNNNNKNKDKSKSKDSNSNDKESETDKNNGDNDNDNNDNGDNNDPIAIFITDTCNKDKKHCIWARPQNNLIDELKEQHWDSQRHLIVLGPQINGEAVNINSSLQVKCVLSFMSVFVDFCLFLLLSGCD